jgi:hypothetical protein
MRDGRRLGRFELQTDGQHALIDGVEVREVALRHVRLGALRVAIGETHLEKRDTLLVITQTEAGDRKMTFAVSGVKHRRRLGGNFRPV